MISEDKSQRAIKGMFDRIAPTYDLLNHTLSFSIDKGWRRRAIKEMCLKEGDLVLDLAAGTGDMGLLALQLCRNCNVVGIDLSSNMLRLAQKKRDKKGDGVPYSLVSGDSYSLPFRDETFDSAMVSFGIRNMEDIPMALVQIRRVLKAGGTLAILEFAMPRNPFARLVYSAYFKGLLPIVGRIISGDGSAYRYLPGSINSFFSAEEMDTMITESGFSLRKSIGLFPGISHLYVAGRIEA